MRLLYLHRLAAKRDTISLPFIRGMDMCAPYARELCALGSMSAPITITPASAYRKSAQDVRIIILNFFRGQETRKKL